MFFIILIIAKIVGALSQILNFGSGLTWPGHLILWFYPSFVKDASRRLPKGSVVVSGTNGKTTTTQSIVSVLRKSGLRVVTNASGANLLNGVASSLALASQIRGGLDAEIGVFESDEASLPSVIENVQPRFLIFLNLFRDQLDRYGEVETLISKWSDLLGNLPVATTLIVNANDPAVSYLGENWKGPVVFFGVEDRGYSLKALPHHADSLFCLECHRRLDYTSVYFSHVGVWSCPHCLRKMPSSKYSARNIELSRESLRFDLQSKRVAANLTGFYNVYNLLAVLSFSGELGLDLAFTLDCLKIFPAHFGRQESLRYRKTSFKLLLSKNPTGFNENLRLLEKIVERDDSLVFLLNDGIADGRDVSWIYDVDFENYLGLLHRGVAISGTRALDLALRLKYAGVAEARMTVMGDIGDLLLAVAEGTKPEGTVFVLPTYTAMLAARQALLGRRIL